VTENQRELNFEMMRIDLHMHSTVSDGTDTPSELLERIREADIEVFALTDHDAIKGCTMVRNLLKPCDPMFINGVEFSCRDEEGKYHILGYNYDPDNASILDVVELGHRYREKKLMERLEYIRKRFGFSFSEADVRNLQALDNPGKPHIGNLMVRYGYAPSKDVAIRKYLNQARFPNEYVRPEQAIQGILKSGGIPVLAHPAYGSGDELITGDQMERRLDRLTGFGLQGVEAFYSTFTPELEREMLSFAEKYNLYVTAGSDYHGKNKPIALGETKLGKVESMPDGMKRFLSAI
jgi:predicted metal-dependent phosphoesterase TrpH